jgi:hypothetical protein
MAKSVVVIFVEGDTDLEFYEALISFYRANYRISSKISLHNLRGIGRYESKLYARLKNQIIPKIKNGNIKVFCCYDTDVFDLAKKPPINWKTVRDHVTSLNIDTFIQVKSEKMIEDWFLKDTSGICRYLKIKEPKKIDAKTGYEKMKILFKKGNKIYQKGSNSHRFIKELNISSIREKVKNELQELENALGLKTMVVSKK